MAGLVDEEGAELPEVVDLGPSIRAGHEEELKERGWIPPEDMHWIRRRAELRDDTSPLGRIDREALLAHIDVLEAELINARNLAKDIFQRWKDLRASKMTDPTILIVPPQNLTPKDKRELAQAGVIVIEMDDPQQARLIRAHAELSTTALLSAAAKAIGHSSTAETAFAKAVCALLQEPPKPSGESLSSS